MYKLMKELLYADYIIWGVFDVFNSNNMLLAFVVLSRPQWEIFSSPVVNEECRTDRSC